MAMQMFVLYRNSSNSYQIAAGLKGNVNKQMRQKHNVSGKEETSVCELLQIISDSSVIKELKDNSRISLELNQQSRKSCDEAKLKQLIFFEFLKTQSCKKEHIYVCRVCGKIIDADNEFLGFTSLKGEELEHNLNIRGDWACEDCREQFSLIMWKAENSRTKNYRGIAGTSKETDKLHGELVKKRFINIQSVVDIRPAKDDTKVVTYILRKFDNQKPLQINEENQNKYQHLILQLFIGYHITHGTGNVRSITICNKCGDLYLKEIMINIGHTSLDTNEIVQKFNFETEWFCSKCDKYSLVIYSMNKYDGKMEFSIKSKDDASVESISKTQSTTNACLKLYTRKIEASFLKEKLSEIKNTKNYQHMTVKDLKNKILEMFIKEISSSVKYHYKICKLCNHIFDINTKDIGFFWIDKKQDLKSQFITKYVCPYHKLKSVLYWNITGWKTLDKLGETKNILKKSDIVCLTETHLTPGNNAVLPNFFNDYIMLNMPAEKPPTGRGSGGLMLLINGSIICKQKQLQFSNKGIFTQIELENERYIVGVLYWRPEPRDESLDDWLYELDNIISINRNNKTKFILGGDFNGRIGQLDCNVGKHLYEESNMFGKRRSDDNMQNKRGRLLLSLMNKYEFVLCNGRTKSDRQGKYTSHTVNGDSVVDYLWISPNCIPFVIDMKVLDVESSGAQYHKALSLELTPG